MILRLERAPIEGWSNADAIRHTDGRTAAASLGQDPLCAHDL